MVRVWIALIVGLGCGGAEKKPDPPKPQEPEQPADSPSMIDPPPTQFDAGAVVGSAEDAAGPSDAARPAAPPSWEFKILKMDVESDGTRLTIDAGSKLGINTGWRASIIDEHSHTIPGGELEILRVTSTTCLARSKLDRRELIKYRLVRIEPP